MNWKENDEVIVPSHIPYEVINLIPGKLYKIIDGPIDFYETSVSDHKVQEHVVLQTGSVVHVVDVHISLTKKLKERQIITYLLGIKLFSNCWERESIDGIFVEYKG